MLGYLERNATDEEYGEVALGVSARRSGFGSLPSRPISRAAVFSRIEDPPSAIAGRLHLELAMINIDMASIWNGIGRPRPASPSSPATTRSPRAQRSGRRTWLRSKTPPGNESTRCSTPAIACTRSGDSHMATLPLWLGSALLSGVGRHSEASDLWELARSRIVCERCSVAFWAEGALLDAGARRCRERPFLAPTRRSARGAGSRPAVHGLGRSRQNRARGVHGRARGRGGSRGAIGPCTRPRQPDGCRDGSGGARPRVPRRSGIRGGRAPSDRAECRRGVAGLPSAGHDGPPRRSPPHGRRPARRPRDPGRRPRRKPIDGTPGRCFDRASDGAPPR